MTTTRRTGLVIGPDFDFMGLAVTSPFVVANRYAGAALYDVHLLSERGGPIRSGLGPDLATEPLGDPAAFDTLLVAAGINPPTTSPVLAEEPASLFWKAANCAMQGQATKPPPPLHTHSQSYIFLWYFSPETRYANS